jgi:YHS domain-containing protein
MRRVSILLAVAALTIAGTALAGSRKTPLNVDKQGVILHGYDVVTYFDLNKPEPGVAAYSYGYMGATWRFVSAENRTKFVHDREKYMPRYGGYCAKAVSENKLADIDPLAYKIVDGKLYLNYDMKVQRIWEEDIADRIEQADKNWPALRPKI